MVISPIWLRGTRQPVARRLPSPRSRHDLLVVRLRDPDLYVVSDVQNRRFTRTSMMFSVVLKPSSIVSRDRVHM